MTPRKTNFEKAMTMLEKYNEYMAADIAERVEANLSFRTAAQAPTITQSHFADDEDEGVIRIRL